MGKVVHLQRVREFISKTPVFRAKDIELIVNSKQYGSLLLHNLARRQEVRRITKGWYSVHDDPLISVFAFRPAYIGLQEALSLRNLWEQETNVVIVASSRVRPGIRTIMGSKVIIHRIRREYFFGFDYLNYEGRFVPVSDTEKTLIDFMYFNELPGRDVLRRIAKKAERKRLHWYLQHYPEKFRWRVRRLIGL